MFNILNLHQGVFSPTGTFTKIFANEGVEISEAEARGPMGIHKRQHIEKILDLPDVQVSGKISKNLRDIPRLAGCKRTVRR